MFSCKEWSKNIATRWSWTACWCVLIESAISVDNVSWRRCADSRCPGFLYSRRCICACDERRSRHREATRNHFSRRSTTGKGCHWGGHLCGRPWRCRFTLQVFSNHRQNKWLYRVCFYSWSLPHFYFKVSQCEKKKAFCQFDIIGKWGNSTK